MTILEALQSMLEYENDDLLTKALLDNGVTSTSATYSAADEQKIDLAAADVYFALCSHPNFKEGSRFIDYSKGTLISMRREILRKWNLLPKTIGAPLDSRYQKIW